MKVTIITVCFNSILTIKNTIDSVLSQDYYDIEYIIIDGGSSDGTIELIKSYSDKIHKFISEKDNGLYDAINKGIKYSSGQLVGILNSDDIFYSNFIISEIVSLFENLKIDMMYADLIYVNDQNKILRKYNSGYFKPSRFKFGLMPAHPTFFCKRSLFDKYGLYRTDLTIASDFELLMRFFMNNSNFTYLKKVIVKMRIGGISTRGFKSNLKIIKEIKISCKLNGVYTNYLYLSLKYPIKILEYFHL